MDGVKDHVMIALLPITTNWSTLEMPHLTLVYSGKIEDHKPSDLNTMAKDCSALAAISQPLTLLVTGVSVLGAPVEEMVQPTKEDKIKEVVAEEVIEAEIVK